MLAITLATTAIGAGVTAYGQRQAGKAREQAAKYNAKVAENQAIQEGMNARERARRLRMKHRRIKASQRVRTAKSGILATGSALEVMAETATNMEMELSDLRWQSDIKQADYQAQAGMSLWEGRQARRAGNIAAGASLLSGAAKGAGTYYTHKLYQGGANA
jgi:hypothetical protein